MVLGARRRVTSCRACAASRSRSTRSAIPAPLGAQQVQGGDDLVEVDQHCPVVGGLPLTAGGLGGVQELTGEFGLLLVDGQELGGGLEVRAGQAGVWVRAVLLGRPAAVPVWTVSGLVDRQVNLPGSADRRTGYGIVRRSVGSPKNTDSTQYLSLIHISEP